ncbi:MAG: hypothetical protein WAZ77_20750 [Candidatus Nitrosopolaris sp.]|jgi:hypothetical protein
MCVDRDAAFRDGLDQTGKKQVQIKGSEKTPILHTTFIIQFHSLAIRMEVLRQKGQCSPGLALGYHQGVGLTNLTPKLTLFLPKVTTTNLRCIDVIVTIKDAT